MSLAEGTKCPSFSVEAAPTVPSSSRGHNADASSADSHPSSVAFDAISEALQNGADRKDAIKQGGAIFGFTIKNPAGEEKSWHIDLKESGKAGKGVAPAGKDKADGESIQYFEQ